MKEIQGKSYSYLSPISINEIFLKHNITFSRLIRMNALKTIVKPKIDKELVELKAKKKDLVQPISEKDLKRLRRIEKFDFFSEVQLENAMEYYHSSVLNESYFTLLWEMILTYLNDTNKQDVLQELNLIQSSVPLEHHGVIAYNRPMNDIFVDDDNDLDGISYEMLRNYYELTSNKKEVVQLADKYHILIPANTSKAFLREKVTLMLKKRSQLTDELLSKINNATVPVLKEILKEFNIEQQDLLTISEMIDMIISSYEKKRNENMKDNNELNTVQKDVQNLSTSLLQQILMNQQLILQSLENFNEGVKTDKKKKLLDRIFNYVVIFLIGVVFVFWIFYAITYL
jgi:hypothetical protein